MWSNLQRSKLDRAAQLWLSVSMIANAMFIMFPRAAAGWALRLCPIKIPVSFACAVDPIKPLAIQGRQKNEIASVHNTRCLNGSIRVVTLEKYTIRPA